MNFRSDAKTTEDLKRLEQEMTELARDYGRLKRFEQDMIAIQPYKVNDRVALSDAVAEINYDKSYGWKGYKNILRPGNTGTVVEVDWNGYHKYWAVGFQFDVDWHSTKFEDWRNSPTYVWVSMRKSRFYMPYSYIRPIEEWDAPIYPPIGADKYEWTDLIDTPPYAKVTTYEEIMDHFQVGVQNERT